MPPEAPDTIRSEQDLERLFGPVAAPSLRKEVPFLHPMYQRWIAASPFVVLATSGPGGLDASPRGDPASLVQVQDAHTLLLPERRGNNRTDSLRNLLHDPRVGLLFLVPGVNETLRVNGTARIRTAPELLDRFALHGHRPRCVLEIRVDAAFFQCGRAMLRSGLWTVDPVSVPTAGEMLQAVTAGDIDGGKYDAELPARQRDTLY